MIDLDLVKNHLQVVGADHDAIIELYVAAAVDTAEQYLNRKLYAVGETVPDSDPTGITIPPAVVSAVLLIVGQLFEFRENVVSGTIVTQVPLGAERLMWPYRILTTG